MPKQLNVNLAFTADTAQAKQQIQELQRSLQELNTNTIKNSGLSKMSEDVLKAQQSVQKLSSILNSSLNADTGRLDLSKFNQQLGSAGMSIQSLATDMTALGADGQKAFLNLANSIVTTQKPMVETNKLLDGMWTALQNTARWQISSSMLHGFMGAISGAYGYAQDLNRSLTDIAIVTGNSVDNMAAFADQANKSAQALSTSTLAYTDAALIYYQQGLNDEEVQARTETTLKMSNVTRQSAEEVSSYMTAIWNNFYDGSESLESFADKITALGAATASSSEEIATGLGQFASLGSSLGLNYDDAVAALATVVAQTRQSASTVGNSFRTLFQRIESLKLGDTLEDGVGLTKYSEALAKVGVQVLDVNGEMRDMSEVIQELGVKWQTLSKAQQNALAQTVGGVRNSNTLIAWMDNFDKFQENLGIAANAEGALQEQADIYAQSWEAAQKRVKAAWQSIYQDLIDSNFFIEILDSLEKVLKGIDLFIDSVGGIPGVLSAVGVVITSLFGDKILSSIEKAQQQLKVMTGVAQKEADYMVQQTMASLDKLVPFGAEDSADAMRVQSLKDQVSLNHNLKTTINDLAAEQKHLTDNQLEYLNSLISTTQQYGEAAAKAREYQEAASVDAAKARSNLRNKLLDSGIKPAESAQYGDLLDGAYQEQIDNIAQMKNAEEASKEIDNLTEDIYEYRDGVKVTAQDVNDFIKTQVELSKRNQQAENAQKNYATQVNRTNLEIAAGKRAVQESITVQEARKKIVEETAEKLEKQGQELEAESQKLTEEKAQLEASISERERRIQALEKDAQEAQNLQGNLNQIEDALQKEKSELDKENQALEKNTKDLEANSKATEENKNAKSKNTELQTGSKGDEPTENFNKGIFSPEFAKGVQTVFSGLSRLTMGLNSLSVAFDALNNKELEPLERVKKALPSLLMGLPMVVSGFTTLGSLIPGVSAAIGIFNAAMMGGATATQAFNSAMLALLQNPATLWFIGITAALVGLVLAIKSATDAWNADAKAAEEAKEKAKELKEEYQELKQSFDDLKSTLEDHQGAVNALKDLKQGTEEWTKAVQDLNQQTLDLISKYPELAQYIENTNGAIHLSQEGMQEYINAQYKETQEKYLDFVKGQQDFYEKDNTSKVTDTARSIGYGQTSQVTTSTGTYTSQKTASNEEILAAVEAFKANSEDFLKAEEDLAHPTKEFAALLAEQGIKNTELVQALWDNRNEIANLSKELDANVAASTGLSDAFYQAGVQNEMGKVIEEKVGDDSYLVAPVEEYLAQQVANTQAQLEANGMESMDAYVQALNEVKQNYIDNADQINNRADRQASADVAGQIMDNGGRLDQREWDEYWNSLSSEDRKLLISVGIDDAKSIPECEEELAKIKEDLDNNYQIDFAVDADVDQEELENLTNYIHDNADAIDDLDDHLVDCRKESAKVAHAILRFDDAIQDVTKNYDDWSHALKKGTMQDAAKAAAEMTDAYGDLLDIDGSQLSSDFLQDAENLDLMKEAINGNEEAYEKLQQLAGEDILAQVGIDKDRWEADQQYIQNRVLDLTGQQWDDIEVGAELNDQAFLDELTNMVNSAGMSAAQAEAYLASMGIDAEVEEQTTEADEVQETASFEPVLTPQTRQGSATTIVGDEPQPVPLDYEVYGVDYQPVPDSITNKKQNKSFTLKVTSAHKSSGGNFKYTNSNHGGGNGGNSGKKGGGCFASGTLITTNHNYKNIEDVKIGDIVLSYNEKTKKNEYSKVLQTMIHNVYEKIYSLFIKDDKLKVTGNHRFLIIHNNEQKWIEAADLQVGDLVLFADGSLHQISKINTQLRFMTVYNFEVSNTHNYYVGENQILAHNKGKSGSSKEKKKKVEKPKEKKENIKEKDRYHNIKEAIEDLNTEMDRLNKNKDRAYGKQRLKYMDDEIKKTKDQIGLTKKYIAEIKSYSKVDRKNLEDALGKGWKDINTGELVGGLGLSDEEIKSAFNEKGILKDYEGLFNKIQDKFDQTATKAYNVAVDEYNKAKDVFNISDQGDAATEVWEKAKEKFEQAEEAYDKQKENYDKQLKYLNQYEDTMNLMQEKEQELLDQQNSLFDKALELVSKKIELKISIADNEQKYLEWVYDNIGDSADRAADRIANLGKQAQSSAKKVQANAEGLRDMLSKVTESYKGQVDFSDINMTLNIDDPKAMLTTINQVIEKMQSKGLEAPVEDIVNLMNGYRDALMEEYNNLRDINEQVTENMVSSFEDMMDSLNENLDKNDGFQSLMDHYKEIRDLLGQEQLGLSDEEMRKWDQQMLDIKRDAAQVAQANYIAAHDAAERARKEYEEAIKSGNQFRIDRAKEVLKTTEEAEKAAQDEALTRLEETLQKAKEMYEQALEDNEKAYQRSLGGGILPTLDKLQDQFDMQKEINDLHLDDYEKYKKLGDLQANINKQLANNPNIKVQGKLKDLMDDVNDKMAAGAEISEGEATILEKRLQLLQAEDQLMAARNAKSAVRMTRDNEGNFSYTYTADTSKIEEAQQNYADKFYDLLDYERQYSEDTQAAILQSYKEFLDKRNDIINDDSLTQSEKEALLRQLEKDMKAKVEFYTNEMEMVTGEMGRLRDEDWADMEKTLGRMLAAPDDFETKFEDTTLGKMAPAWKDAKDGLEGFVNAAKTLTDADLGAYGKWIQENEISMQNVGSSTAEYGEKLSSIYDGLKTKSTEAKDAAKGMADQMQEDFPKIIEQGREFDEKFSGYLSNITTNLENVVKAINDVTAALSGVDKKWNLQDLLSQALGKNANPKDSEILDEDPTAGFDTGGYTGKWGSTNGKLAVLHQKEIVLNEDDTSNMLKAIDIVRSISNAINLNNAINPNMFSNIIDYSKLAAAGTTDLQQQVHIEASFPNVQSHSEIELAFNNLINSASQYVNRKR